MFLRPIDAKARLVIISIVISSAITGCEKKENADEGSADSNSPANSGFVLNFKDVTEPQVIKSELFLAFIEIRQYHIGQQQPTMYSGEDISRIIFHYQLFKDTEEWMLVKMDIHLKNGSVKSENPKKGWDVALDMTPGDGPHPVGIEQHFKPK